MKRNGIYRWLAASRGFLDRAKNSLADFDGQDDVQQLFVATLMLRFGIEARLFEYIEAELPAETREADVRTISEFAASKLLRQLTSINPRAAHETTHVFRPSDEPEKTFGFRYTPVTRELASIHGQLGALLHFNYFKRNPHWYVDARSTNSGTSTILDARDLVARGIAELEKATQGTLLNNPSFAVRVEEIREEAMRPQSASKPESSDSR
jgi:hypothetical protein